MKLMEYIDKKVYMNGYLQGIVESVRGRTLIVKKGRCGWETERFEIRPKHRELFEFEIEETA